MNVRSVRKWLLSRRRVESLLSLYAIGLLFSSYDPLVLKVGTTRVLRPDWVLFVPLVTYVTYSAVTSGDLFERSSRGSYLTVGAFLTFVVSTLGNYLYVPFDAFTVLGQLLYVVTLFCCVSYLRVDGRTFRTVFQVWVGLSVVIGIYVMYQAIALNHGLPFWHPYPNPPADLGRDMYGVQGYNRPAGLFTEPRWLSGFYLLGIAFLVGARVKNARLFWSRRADATALAIVLLAFVLTASMAGYLSLTALFVFGALLPWTRRSVLKTGIAFYTSMAVLLAILSVCGSAFATMILARTTKILDILLVSLSSLSDILVPDEGISGAGSAPSTTTPESSSNQNGGGIANHISPGSIGIRAARAQTGIRAWLSNPLFGVGAGQFPHWSHAHDMTEKFPVEFISPLDELNNFWLQVLVASGVFGFTAVTAVWAETLNRLRGAFRRNLDGSEYLPSCVFVLFVLFVDGFWGIGIVHPLRWFFPALVYSYVTRPEN